MSEVREAFEKKANELGMVLDCHFFEAGNNYTESDTRLAYSLFEAGWQAKQLTVQGWIGVDERLPEDDQRVLVLNKDSFVDLCRRTEWKDKSRGDTFYLWELDDDESYYSIEEVTHWMPLPAAPKELSHD